MNNQLRLIGGEWRSRVIRFPDVPGLRPTASRIRETLFNWLRYDLAGSRCLDLFAGSGALGFEAASRGAALVQMVEVDPMACQALCQNAQLLDTRERIRIMQTDSRRFLAGASECFDLVFLDPPFHKDYLADCCQQLEQYGWLAENARIYVEREAAADQADLPPHWQTLRSKTSGEVGYHLFQRAHSPVSKGME